MTLQKGNKSSAHMNNNSNNRFGQECADCSSTNTKWISINHGVILCDDCCLVHRGLGRCISIIKSIARSYWPQSLIDMLFELVRSNSNQIWEAHVHDSSQPKHLRKKPSPKDSINPTKTNYIKQKYENMTFIARGKYSSIEELNQQLYTSVKTQNYEQTLRILSQGADANYRHHDDGQFCIHMAVQSNQIGQVELLCIYGADLSVYDKNGNTPHDLAKSLQLTQIVDRLVELQFELTDELSAFVCNKRPEHKNGTHFFIPELSESSAEGAEFCKTTKKSLQELPDHLFEELCRDVYDEVDRRQLETIWKCCVSEKMANEPIPFLVIKSCFSQTRNQLRQKLARFNTLELQNFIIEILLEARQRYQTLVNPHKSMTKLKKLNEDEELYDRVPSDEDYATVATESTVHTKQAKSLKEQSSNSSSGHMPSRISSSSKFEHAEMTLNSILNNLNEVDLKPKQQPLQQQQQEHIKSLQSIQNENELMQQMIYSLMEENAQLRAEKMLLTTTNAFSTSANATPNRDTDLYSKVNKKSSSLKHLNSNFSLVSLKSPTKQQQQQQQQQNESSPNVLTIHLNETTNEQASLTELKIHRFGTHDSRDDSVDSLSALLTSKLMRQDTNSSSSSLNSPIHMKSTSLAPPLTKPISLEKYPSKHLVIKKMKKITKTVQELYTATKESKFEYLKYFCEKVNSSVNEMIEIFQQPIDSQEIQECLSVLLDRCKSLLDLIEKYNSQILDGSERVAFNSGSSELSEAQMRQMIVSNMISYSYDIAFTVKKIVCLMGGTADGI